MEPTTTPAPEKQPHPFMARLRKLRTDAEDKVRANPLAALAIVFGAGLLIGVAPRRGLTRAAMFLASQLLVGDVPDPNAISTMAQAHAE